VAERNIEFKADYRSGAGYLKLDHIARGEAAKQVYQEEQDRVLDYSRDGRLLGIEFLDLTEVNLEALPQDDSLPGEGELVVLFNANDIVPHVSYDLVGS
jgi:hypothetical protein